MEAVQNGPEAGGVVGVVHHHPNPPVIGEYLGPPGHSGSLQPLADGLFRQPQLAAHRHRRQGVLDVVPPGEGDGIGGVTARHREAAAQGAGRLYGGHGAPLHPAGGGEPEGGHRGLWGQLGGHLGPGHVLPIAHRPGALGEEGGLAGGVLGVVGVLPGADVVGGEVEEDPGGEGEPRHPAVLHGLGGHLHHHVGAPLGYHIMEQLVEEQRVRGGVGAVGPLLPPYVCPHGADHPRCVPGREQNVPHHVGGGGLALGAGDADEGEALGGVAIKGGGQVGQGVPGLFHHKEGDRTGQGHRGHHSGGPPVHRLGDVLGAVGVFAGDGHEEGAGGDGAGVAGEGGNVHILVTGVAEHGQQRGKFHGSTPLDERF